MIKTLYREFLSWVKPIQISGLNNSVRIESKLGKAFHIKIDGGGNRVDIGKHCLLTNTKIQVHGDNNQIIIENNVRLMGPCKIIMGGNATLHIKWNAGIRGVEFNLNGANIEVGELCMFSYGVTLRNHDSHKILDAHTGEIMNPAKDIVLGRHVWIGQNATILKGCNIGDDSVIGFGSIVTKSCGPGSVMTGIPAKIVKENIRWDY